MTEGKSMADILRDLGLTKRDNVENVVPTRGRLPEPPYEIDPESGCWNWLGCKTELGYGRRNVGGRPVGAHILSYQEHVGLVPEGLELDHLCCNPSCVNPAHLEPVTHAENMRRWRQTLGWSRANACCVECGTTERKHQAKGLCTRCWSRAHPKDFPIKRAPGERRPIDASDLEAMAKMRADGATYRAIGSELGWDERVVRNALVRAGLATSNTRTPASSRNVENVTPAAGRATEETARAAEHKADTALPSGRSRSRSLAEPPREESDAD